MAQIPTAAEILEENLISVDKSNFKDGHYFVIEQAMIEFAKLHAEAYRREVHKRVLIIDNKGAKALVHGLKDFEGNWRSFQIDKHSVTNVYPLSNIK